jgi:hypothetical protein
MRWMLMLLIWLLATTDIVGWETSLGHGLSIKNVLLYTIALALLFRIALSGEFRLRLPIIQGSFGLWIGYALLSFVACAVVIYPGYDVKQSAIALKSEVIDYALFFLAAFYAARDKEDGQFLTKTLAAAVGACNLATIADVVGLTHFGVEVGTTGAEADRVFGVFGHANESGATIVCLLPMLVAAAVSSRGVARRLFWYTGATASLTVLLLTVSRGAFVAAAIGYPVAVILCRRHLPLSRVLAWVAIGGATAVIALGIAGVAVPQVGHLIVTRLLGAAGSVDLASASQGRTDIWITAISEMMSQPLTLLTGFGWNIYDSRFLYVTHNQYLDQFFNLGVVGVGVFVIILFQSVRTARAAIDVATAEFRPYMIAVVFGIVALALNVFFTNLSKPWPYIWLYLGVSMRIAVDILARDERRAAVPLREPSEKLLPGVPGIARVGIRGGRLVRHG